MSASSLRRSSALPTRVAARDRPLVRLARAAAWAGLAPLAVFVGLAAPAAEARAAAPSDCMYEVAKGDTLDAIAARHGLRKSDLVGANPSLRKNPDMLRIGQTLDLCAAKASAKARAKADAQPSSGAQPGDAKAERTGRACGKGGTLIEHEVRSGEVLGAIARRYDVTVAELRSRNKALKSDADALRVGQIVLVCSQPERVKAAKACGYATPLWSHEVVPGETLGAIAGRYGVRRRELLRLNPAIKNPNALGVGQRLRVCPNITPTTRTKLRHSVQSGESLSTIAAKYDLTLGELTRYQQWPRDQERERANQLRPGQELVVWVDGGPAPGFGGVDDDTGTLPGGVQLPPGRDYHVKWADAAWGTTHTVRAIQSAVVAYKRRYPKGPKVHVGDLSKRAGGRFPPHLSHQKGTDVDVGYVLKGELADATRFHAATASNLDVPRTWALLKAFIDTDEVKYIFVDWEIQKQLYEYAQSKGVAEDTLDELFQYPRSRRRAHGIMRHWKGHVNHFHVRFRR